AVDRPPGVRGGGGGVRRPLALRELGERVVVVVDGQPDLVQVVRALHPVGGLPDLLHRGQQQANEDRDDGNDNEQLDERKGGATARGHGRSLGMDERGRRPIGGRRAGRRTAGPTRVLDRD